MKKFTLFILQRKMKNTQLNNPIRILLFLCAIMVVFVLFIPIWKIELSAPQYPEGLEMTISAKGLGGDVAILNGLNHYIGMKTLHNEDFIEFKILPYLISIFALFFFFAAIIGNRKLMYVLFVSFVLFGTISMIDFWKWEYDYGHNLDPHAAIVVPGMSYQPPLIGYKKLLNFGAYSIPDIGGWLFILSGAILAFCVILDYRLKQKAKTLRKIFSIFSVVLIVLSISSCTMHPEPIKVGSDGCHYCKMTISDNRYGAEVITKKGKVFKYDELHCLFSEIAEGGIEKHTIKDIYVTDFCEGHGLIKELNGFYLRSNELKSPMGGNLVAFSSADSLNAYIKKLNGESVSWGQIISSK